MDGLSHLALEWKPIYLLGRKDVKLDVFKHSLSAADGLPPYAQARIIDLISNQLRKARPEACLWVSVDAPGNWYLQELRRLVKYRIPTAILPTNQSPADGWDFRPYAKPHYEHYPIHPRVLQPFVAEMHGLNENTLRVLRVLARLKTGHTLEIASLAAFSNTHIRRLLRRLRALDLIEWKQIDKYKGWEIKTKGLRLAHRSWNIPKGAHFASHRREFRYAGERHRRAARMWRAWLESAYPSVEIWECWTEVSLHYGIPDALAWGQRNKREYLFWLEVDSGHSSTKIIHTNYERRLRLAYSHSKDWGIPIIFCIMGPPWVVNEFRWCIPILYPNLAIIGHDWRDFGRLPVYEFGQWNQDLSETDHWQKGRSDKKLTFDPKQYPPKPKTNKVFKQIKQKTNKPRFMDHSSISNDRDWERDPNDK